MLCRIGEDRLAPFAAAFELAVQGKALGQLQQVGVQLVETSEGQGRVRLDGRAAWRHLRHGRNVVLLGLDRGIGLLERGHALAHHLVGALLRNLSRSHQGTGVLLANRRMRADDLVQRRLRERRLVAFVVTVAAIAHQVDQVVELEALPVCDRQPGRLDAGDRIIGIHVGDRNLEATRQAAGVTGAEGLFRIGGEADLVVGDDVDDAADVVALEPRQVQGFGHHALARKGRVAVDENRQHLALVDDRRAGLIDRRGRGARHAVQDRVDRFEVARVGRHRDHDLLGQSLRLRLDPRAGVILHVAHPAEVDAQPVLQDGVLELRENLRVRLLQDVREHIQAATMGHRDHHVLHAAFRRVVNDLVDDRHHHVEAFDREPRLARERPLQEALEGLDLGDAVEQFRTVDRI